MNSQPVFLIADTHLRPNNAIAATRQPPRLRALPTLSTFLRPVDDTALNQIDLPPPYTAVNPCYTRQEGELGEHLCPAPGAKHSGSERHPDKISTAVTARRAARARESPCLLESQFGHPSKGLFALHHRFSSVLLR